MAKISFGIFDLRVDDSRQMTFMRAADPLAAVRAGGLFVLPNGYALSLQQWPGMLACDEHTVEIALFTPNETGVLVPNTTADLNEGHVSPEKVEALFRELAALPPHQNLRLDTLALSAAGNLTPIDSETLKPISLATWRGQSLQDIQRELTRSDLSREDGASLAESLKSLKNLKHIDPEILKNIALRALQKDETAKAMQGVLEFWAEKRGTFWIPDNFLTYIDLCYGKESLAETKGLREILERHPRNTQRSVDWALNHERKVATHSSALIGILQEGPQAEHRIFQRIAQLALQNGKDKGIWQLYKQTLPIAEKKTFCDSLLRTLGAWNAVESDPRRYAIHLRRATMMLKIDSAPLTMKQMAAILRLSLPEPDSKDANAFFNQAIAKNPNAIDINIVNDCIMKTAEWDETQGMSEEQRTANVRRFISILKARPDLAKGTERARKKLNKIYGRHPAVQELYRMGGPKTPGRDALVAVGKKLAKIGRYILTH